MKNVLIGLLVFLVLVAAIGFFTPKEYTLAKSVTIQAPPEAVHRYVGELSKWPEWAPWADMDPTMETKLGATTTGVGAHQSWSGKDGDGELTFTRCDESGIAYDMAFLKEGVRTPAKSEMTYTKVAEGTQVTWTMEGSWEGAMPPVVDGWMKILTPFMVGSAFDDGLEKLKSKVEAAK